MKKYVKKDEHTLEVEQPKIIEKPSDVETEIKIYDYDFLLKQKEAIIKQRDEQISSKQTEIDEVNELIQKSQELGITSKEAVEKL